MPRYIDAEALKDVIQQHDYPLADRLNSVDNGMFTLGIFRAIDHMPAVFPDEVRGKGEWIKIDRVADMEAFKCSACGSYVHVSTVYGEPMYEYCPMCGARMEVSEDA